MGELRTQAFSLVTEEAVRFLFGLLLWEHVWF